MSAPGQEFQESEYLGLGLLAVTSATLIERLLSGQQIDDDDKYTLLRAKRFLADVSSGAKLVHSGVSSNATAVENVRKLAYSVEPLQLMQERIKADEVESVFERVATSLEESVEKGPQANLRDDLVMAKDFFSQLQRFLLVLVESGKTRTGDAGLRSAMPRYA